MIKNMHFVLHILLACFIIHTAYANEFTLTSPGFPDKSKIPAKYTCDEGNESPPLTWKNPPNGTKTFAIILASLDTPIGKTYNWILYNLPATTTKLEEGCRLSDDISVGMNSFDELSYRGPCPSDDKNHRYTLTIYALDQELDIMNGASIHDVLDAMKGHILQKAEITFVYNH